MLKRVALAGALVTMLATPASAQRAIGVIGGWSVAKVKMTPSLGVPVVYRNSFAIGGVFHITLHDNLALQVEPMLIGKGAHADFVIFPGYEPEPIDIVSRYFQIPVSLKLSFGEGSVRPYVMAGPSVAYTISAKQKASYIPPEAEDIKGVTADFDVALGLGGGVSVAVRDKTLFVQGRYMLGVYDINRDPSIPEVTTKTRGVEVLAGATFRF